MPDNDKAKTVIECRRAYAVVAAKVTALVAQLPKIEAEIRERVKKEMGDRGVALANARVEKRQAAIALQAAEAAEAIQRPKP